MLHYIIKLCSIYIECGHTLIPIYTNVWPEGYVVKHCLQTCCFVVFIIQCSPRNSNLLFQINCHFPTIIQYMYFVLPNSKTLLIYSLPSATNYVDYTVASIIFKYRVSLFITCPISTNTSLLSWGCFVIVLTRTTNFQYEDAHRVSEPHIIAKFQGKLANYTCTSYTKWTIIIILYSLCYIFMLQHCLNKVCLSEMQ